MGKKTPARVAFVRKLQHLVQMNGNLLFIFYSSSFVRAKISEYAHCWDNLWPLDHLACWIFHPTWYKKKKEKKNLHTIGATQQGPHYHQVPPGTPKVINKANADVTHQHFSSKNFAVASKSFEWNITNMNQITMNRRKLVFTAGLFWSNRACETSDHAVIGRVITWVWKTFSSPGDQQALVVSV